MEPNNKIMLMSPGDVKKLNDFENFLQASVFLYENKKAQKKTSEAKLENEIPLFYTKPIYVATDYDPL